MLPVSFKENCHFHFLNFPTASSLLHIRKILVHWPFLEISGPQKWVVGATLALKQKFLDGTLLKQLTINNPWTPISTRIFIFESLRGLIIGILCYYTIKLMMFTFLSFRPNSSLQSTCTGKDTKLRCLQS